MGLILTAFLAGKYPAKSPDIINTIVAAMTTDMSTVGFLNTLISLLPPLLIALLINSVSPTPAIIPMYPKKLVINKASSKINFKMEKELLPMISGCRIPWFSLSL